MTTALTLTLDHTVHLLVLLRLIEKDDLESLARDLGLRSGSLEAPKDPIRTTTMKDRPLPRPDDSRLSMKMVLIVQGGGPMKDMVILV